MYPNNTNKTLTTKYEYITTKIKHKNPLTFFYKRRHQEVNFHKKEGEKRLSSCQKHSLNGHKTGQLQY